MIFGELGLAAAEGAVLAHTMRLPGRVLKKGSVLDASALDALRAAGIASIIAARLEPGDVDENAAASRLADALMQPGLRRTRAGTGRVNLIAEQPGLLAVAADGVDRINQVNEALTLGTLPAWSVVAANEMVATVKVIPFAVPGPMLVAAEQAAREAPLRVHPFRPLKAGMVLTELPGLKESVLDGTVEATRQRIVGLGGTLLDPLRCPHRTADIANALRTLLAGGADLLMVAGASAVVDRRDVAPAGIVAAGGEILHFGMPVDPGNLICIGRIGADGLIPALVLPGCARSPKLNGIDWVLARLYAGLPVGPAEVSRMGVGGLLKDAGPRPLPRAKAPTAGVKQSRPQAAAIVLAAGRSSRMAPQHKLLVTDRAGKPMIARVVDNVLSSRAGPVLVVTGHRAEDVRAALANRPVQHVHAENYQEGLSASLRAGLAALPADSPAVLICLADMPLVTGRMIDRLLDAFDPDEGRTIVAPTFQGKIGNPVLWDRRFFPEMCALSGDVGARRLLERHAEMVAEIELGSDAVLRDFDTVDSLAALPHRLQPPD